MIELHVDTVAEYDEEEPVDEEPELSEIEI